MTETNIRPGSRFQSVAQRLKAALRPRLIVIGARSGTLSKLYYLFCSDAFNRECRSVAAGSARYLAAVHEKRSKYFLKRSIHRIEKGLLMSSRREVFALDYILDTTATLANLSGGRVIGDSPFLVWAYDVLAEYFSIVGAHPTVEAARAVFEEVESTGHTEPPVSSTSCRPASKMVYSDLAALVRTRRSIRWFLPRTVPRDVIEKAVDLARLSPSACNRQAYQIRILDNPEEAQQVASLAMGTAGFSHNIPALAVIVARLRAFAHERDRHLIYVDGALAAMTFMYALEAQSVGSCPVNWPDIEHREQALESLLKLAPDERPVLFVCFGYPDPEGKVGRSVKIPLNEAIRYGLNETNGDPTSNRL